MRLRLRFFDGKELGWVLRGEREERDGEEGLRRGSL